MLTQSREDYLTAIFRLTEAGRPTASTQEVARELSVSRASATDMFKKLAAEGLVEYREYEGVALSADGRRDALLTLRRHRLAERFLTDILDISWDRVHEMADRLEHALPEEVVERFSDLLGDPSTCPHGHPIPSAQGELVNTGGRPLVDLRPGDTGTIMRVAEDDADLLRYLEERALVPGTRVAVLAVEPFEGPLALDVGGEKVFVSLRVAGAIWLSPETVKEGATHDAER